MQDGSLLSAKLDGKPLPPNSKEPVAVNCGAVSALSLITTFFFEGKFWHFDLRQSQTNVLRDTCLVSPQLVAFHYIPCWNVYCPTVYTCGSFRFVWQFFFSHCLWVNWALVEEEPWETLISFRHSTAWRQTTIPTHTSSSTFGSWPPAQTLLLQPWFPDIALSVDLYPDWSITSSSSTGLLPSAANFFFKTESVTHPSMHK